MFRLIYPIYSFLSLFLSQSIYMHYAYIVCMEENEYVQIRIKSKTVQRLKKHGQLGSTYDSLINDMLDKEENEQS